MSGRKIGVILAGCGHRDGGEIQEATLTLLALDTHGAESVCMAPDREQVDVVNHLTAQLVPSAEKRNLLLEAARIARGRIRDIREIRASDLDGLILPGGSGITRNLCDYASKQAACRVDPEVARLIREVHAAGKPIGAICIAPVIVARVLGEQERIELTSGDDPETAAHLEAMGAVHRVCPANRCHVDHVHRVVSTPAYMSAKRISEAHAGIDELVKRVLELCS